MLEKALQVIKTNLDEFENEDLTLKKMSENLDIITEKFLELNQNNESSTLQTNISTVLQNINSLSEQLKTSENVLLKDSQLLIKDIHDDIELVIEGMNNINHYVNEVINDNDRLGERMEVRLNSIERKSNITTGIIILLFLVTLAELALFFLM